MNLATFRIKLLLCLIGFVFTACKNQPKNNEIDGYCLPLTYNYGDSIDASKYQCIKNLSVRRDTADTSQKYIEDLKIITEFSSLNDVSLYSVCFNKVFQGYCTGKNIKRFNITFSKIPEFTTDWISDTLNSLSITHTEVTDSGFLIKNTPNLEEISFLYSEFQKFPIDSSIILILKRLILRQVGIKESDLKYLPRESALESLELSFSEIDRFPSRILGYKYLKKLNLSGNFIMSVPEQLFRHNELQSIDLGLNNIQDIELSRNQNNSLKRLKLDGNKLNRIPLNMKNFKSLVHLDIQNNKIKQIDFDSIPNELISINLAGNQLSKINGDISKLKKLRFLYLHNNALVEMPDGLRKLENISELTLNGNRFNNIVLDSFPKKNLRVLSLSDNHLNGVELDFHGFQELQKLYLANVGIKSLPEGIFSLKKLEEIDLSNNPLKEIPHELLQLPSLKRLILPVSFRGKINSNIVEFN